MEIHDVMKKITAGASSSIEISFSAPCGWYPCPSQSDVLLGHVKGEEGAAVLSLFCCAWVTLILKKRGREACLSCILISSFICNNADILAGKESTCNAGDPGSIPGSGSSPAEVISYPLQCSWASLVTQTVKNLPAVQRPGYNPWVGKIPWRRPWQPTPAFLPGELPWTEAPGRLQSMMSQRVTSVEWISTA